MYFFLLIFLERSDGGEVLLLDLIFILALRIFVWVIMILVNLRVS